MREFIRNYKKPLVYSFLIIIIFLIMIAVGFPLGFLSQDPDGLERVIIDFKGKTWLESLETVWYPILSWLENEYLAGIVGILASLFIVIGVFKLLKYTKRKEFQQI